MPELPEVQAVVNHYNPIFVNQKIESISNPNGYANVFETHSLSSLNDCVRGTRIEDVFRRGKYIVIKTSAGYLCIHLRMTGQLQESLDRSVKNKHCSFAIHLENGKTIYFKDYRKFGRLYHFSTLDPLNAKLGVEPFSSEFSHSYVAAVLKKSAGMIKPFLLNQKHIAGLGNIYVDEALWRAKIHPKKRSNSISRPKVMVLAKAIPDILKKAIDFNGTTIINFSYGNEVPGDFKQFLNVFGKEGTSCSRCDRTIKKIYVAQRGTHYCPNCQRP